MPVRNSINNQSTGFTVNTPTSGISLTVNQTTASSAIATSQTFGGAATIQNIQTSNDVQPVYYNVYKRRTGGTVSNGDVIHQINSLAQNVGVDYVATQTRSVATTVGAGFIAGSLDWWTTSSAGVTSQRMNLSPDGLVTINAPAAAGSALTVNGVNSAANYSLISQASVAGGIHNAARLWNYNGTAGSATQVSIDVFNQLATTGGDPSLRFLNIGIRAVTLGIDSSTDQFVIANSSALGTSNILTWTASNNQINLPLQASFLEVLTADAIDQTGNGTTYKLIGFTEIYDQSGSFNTVNGEFSAPRTGRYMLTAQARVYNFTGATGCQLQLITSNRNYYSQQVPTSSNGYFSINIAVNADMDQGDIAYIQVQITGMAGDTADIAGDGVNGLTWFSGCLLQ